MRIGINATTLNDRPSGAKQRFVGLYGALFRARSDVEFLIYEPRDCCVSSWFSELPNVRGIATRMPSRGRWRRFLSGLGYWRRQLRADKLDLFESLHLPMISAPDCPTMLTVHDFRAVLDDVPLPRRALYRHVLRRSLRRADVVITVSDTMRDDLLRIEPTAIVSTIHNGIDAAPFAAGNPAAAHIDTPFLLAVGHFEPRKNYDTLLRAFVSVAACPDSPRLVIVGKDGGSLAHTDALVDALGLAGKVILLHDVDNVRLIGLYRAARLLVFPSTYEGFGIPVLEAMAADLPMALSNLPVFREITEGRAIFFDPHDSGAMANAMIDFLRTASHQTDQCGYGRRRLADFAFSSLAKKLEALQTRTVSEADAGAWVKRH